MLRQLIESATDSGANLTSTPDLLKWVENLNQNTRTGKNFHNNQEGHENTH